MVTIVDYGAERVKALSNIGETNFCIINKKAGMFQSLTFFFGYLQDPETVTDKIVKHTLLAVFIPCN